MGIRETINRRQRTTTGIVIVAVAVAVAVLVWSQSSPAGRLSQAYYADESGAAFFADDVDRVYPFDHNGTRAYRAYVYQGSDGKPFVSYLARYNETTHGKLQELLARNEPSLGGEIAQARNNGIEVKKPGGEKWVPLLSAQGQEIASHPTLADGSTAKLLMP